jgi:dual specificity phosphatase 3
MGHDDRVTLTVANAHFVTDRLAVGGDLDLYDAELVVAQVLELKAAGITHVLDVRQEWDDAVIWADVPGVVYR